MATNKFLVAVKVKDGVYLGVVLDETDIKALENAGLEVLREKPKDPGDTYGKKGFAFLAPVFAGLPGTAVIVGAATLGIIGGAAGAVGSKVGNWLWPDKKEAK